VKGNYTISTTNHIRLAAANSDAYATRGEAKRFDGTNWVNTDVTGFDANPGDLQFRIYVTRNDTALTLPSGYTQWAQIGWVINDGLSDFVGFSATDRLLRFMDQLAAANFGASGVTQTSVWMFLPPLALPPTRVMAYALVINSTNGSISRIGGVPDAYAASVLGIGVSERVTSFGSNGCGYTPPFPTEFQAFYAFVSSGSGEFIIEGFTW
jgi:hypothetical protein